MKKVLFVLIISISILSCKKAEVISQPVNVTVKGYVGQGGLTYDKMYWDAGIIFSRVVDATGVATVTWYFSGKSESLTMNFKISNDHHDYGEKTTIPATYNVHVDSIRITSFHLDTGNYIVTVNN